MMDGDGWVWALVSLSLVLFLMGLALGVWAFTQPGPGSSSAQGLLGERLARGEVTPEEYAERQRVLGAPRLGAPASFRVLALILGVVGLVGVVVIPAASRGHGHGWWGGMMNGPMMGRTRTEGSAPAPEVGAPEIRVIGAEFSLSPNEVTVSGETVNVVFDNRGAAYHTLTVPEPDFELTADGGERAEGALRAPTTSGTYELVCAVPGHAEAGMRGRLVVEDAQQ